MFHVPLEVNFKDVKYPYSQMTFIHLNSHNPQRFPTILIFSPFLPNFLHSCLPLILHSLILPLSFLPSLLSSTRVFLGTDKKKIIERLRYEVRTTFYKPSRSRARERERESEHSIWVYTIVLYYVLKGIFFYLVLPMPLI